MRGKLKEWFKVGCGMKSKAFAAWTHQVESAGIGGVKMLDEM